MAVRFDLVDLRLFVNIADCCSVTRGAAQSHLSLAAASARIRNLEEAVGTKLLYRGTSGVTPTPAGETLGHHARLVLQQLEKLHGDLQEHSQGVTGLLRISASSAPITEFLEPALGAYLAVHPAVDIDLRERPSPEIVRAVAEGHTDIGIVSGDVCTDGLQVIPYRHARLVLVVPARHELAATGSVMFSDALGLPHVALQESNPIFQFLTQVTARLNRQLRVRIRLSHFEVACRMVEANIGVCVLPDSAAVRYASTMAIRVVRLNDEWAEGHMRICLRSEQELPSFARDFVNLLKIDAEAA
ncbi:MAG: LysR family transcriptional regulator [Lautropia sp.]